MADLAAAGSRVRAALEGMFGAVAEIGAAFAEQRRGCRAADAPLTPDRLSGLREVIWRQLGLLPGADGGQDGFARIRLNLDPESVDR